MNGRSVAVIVAGLAGAILIGAVAANSTQPTASPDSSPNQVFVPSGSPLPDGVVMPIIPGDSAIPESVYARPFGAAGVQIKSGDAIDLPFEIYPPASLGTPTSVWVDNSSDAVHAQVAWVYDDPKFGTFDLIEGVAIEDQSELEATAEQSKGCTVTTDASGSTVECTTATFEVVTLDSGVRALVSVGSSTQNIRWLQPIKGLSEADLTGHGNDVALEVKILAQTDTGMSTEDLTSLANRV